VLSFGFGALPVVRDIVQGYTKYNYGMSPGATVIERFISATEQAASGEDMTPAQIKATVRGLGLFLHLPAGQFIKSLEFFDALSEGELEDPIREFFFGVTKK